MGLIFHRIIYLKIGKNTKSSSYLFTKQENTFLDHDIVHFIVLHDQLFRHHFQGEMAENKNILKFLMSTDSYLKECCSDISTNKIVFASVCPYVSYPYFKMLAYSKKTGFGQDVFNTHGVERTHANIRILFPKHHNYFFCVLNWKAPKIKNYIKFCKDAKTIIVVVIWLNS